MSFIFLISVIVFVVLTILVRTSWKGTIAVAGILVNAVISSSIAINALNGNAYSEILYGGLIFGEIALRLDAVSAWFILLTNFTAITGILYGKAYLKHTQGSSSDLSLHFAAYIINHAALIAIFTIQNSMAFLCVWELMALSAFVLVIYDHQKMDTLKAGMNYLIQSHISIIFLTLGFVWLYSKTGSLDFNALRSYCLSAGNDAALILFIVFFIGFGIKAGFVPFHTWLPYAHPAAPSHVSGVMSGVIIKSGIYGILRIVLLTPENHLAIGYIILSISVISSVYGVMLAIVQHNLKRLLAYHSIENIGIIGIGIGIGTIGSGLNNSLMAFAGYAGALLHVLNHSLFKSMLFYTSGNILHGVRTLMMDKMGGLIHKMPYTAYAFLIAAAAICGLPPLNGFVSEFLIYSGLLTAIAQNQTPLTIILAVTGLTLTGGLAILCFTKAFGIIFLGTSRSHSNHAPEEMESGHLIPLYMIAFLIFCIGLFPRFFINSLKNPVAEFISVPVTTEFNHLPNLMQNISLAAWSFVFLIALLFLIRRLLQYKSESYGPTWGCGYTANSPKIQYTATSFVRPYAKMLKPVFEVKKTENAITSIIPRPMYSESHFYDKLEAKLVDWPTRNLRWFLGRFKFLQNGSVQFYVLYGVVFIGICIAIPFILRTALNLIEILKQL